MKESFLTAQSISKTVSEAMWSDKIQTSWHPPEGFFTKSVSEIASGFKNSNLKINKD